MQKELPPPTAEQQTLLADIRSRPGESRKVMAGPGTGKTTSLRMIAGASSQRGTYIAYNRPIAEEAKAVLPSHVKATTAHAMAFGQTQMFNQPKGRIVGRIFPEKVIEAISFPLARTGHTELVAAGIALEGLNKFYNSVDSSINETHFQGLTTRATNLSPIMRAAQEVWDMQRGDTAMALTHDSYLKMWQQNDRIGTGGSNYVLFDEAQDASPVMIDIINRMGIPVTWMGDQDQSIYQWRGAVNAMEMADCRAFPLSQSWRFGQRIAEMANAVRTGKMAGRTPSFDLVGAPGLDTEIGYTPPPGKRTILTRTNAEWFAHAIEFPGIVHVVGGIDETARMLEAAHSLCFEGRSPRNAPPTISRFNSWGDLEIHAEELQDRELLFIKKIVTTYGSNLPRMIGELRARHIDSDHNAELILSTAHKAKGREFDVVSLGDGFAGPHEAKWHDLTEAERVQETNLLYVSVSRAKKYLVPCTAAEVFLAGYQGRIKKINRDNMARVFGTPLPEAQKGAVDDVVRTFMETVPIRTTALWRGAEAEAAKGVAQTPPQTAGAPVRHTAPPRAGSAPAMTAPRQVPNRSQEPAPAGQPPAAPTGGGAFGQNPRTPPAPAPSAPSSAGAEPAATGKGDTWHHANDADHMLIESLLAGNRFDQMAETFRVREEILVGRSLRILSTEAGTRLTDGMGSMIHPENIGRMNDLAAAINARVVLDLHPQGVGPPAREQAIGMEAGS